MTISRTIAKVHRGSSSYTAWLVAACSAICGGCDRDTPAEAVTANPAATVWHVSVAGDDRGSFDEDDLRTDVVTARLPGEAMVWHAGLDGWVSVDVAFPGVGSAAERARVEASRRMFLDLCRRADALGSDDALWEPIYAYKDRPGPATEAAARRALARHADLLDGARERWTMAAPLDLAYAQGFMLLTPHGSGARRLAQMLTIDSALSAAAGDGVTAVADVVAVARLAEQLAGDEQLICSLASLGMLHRLGDRALPALSTVAVSDDDRARVRAATRWLEQTDPLRLTRGLRRERQHVVESVVRVVTPIHERPGTDLRRFMDLEMSQLEDFDYVLFLYGTDAIEAVVATDDLDRAAARCRAGYDELLLILETDDWPAPAEIVAFAQRVDAGEFGPMGAAILTKTLETVGKIVQNRSTVEKVLASTR